MGRRVRSDDTTELVDGHWERQGRVMVWVPAPEVIYETHQPPVHTPEGFGAVTIEYQARKSSDGALRVAHAAYARGDRDPLTIARNREWQRRYQKSRRTRNA